MKIVHLPTSAKQTLFALLVCIIVAATFFATKAWAMDSESASPVKIRPSVYDEYVKARPTSTTTSTTTTTTTVAPTTTNAVSPPITTPKTTIASGDIWEALANCESGGRWDYNGGSGFDGGLQFLPSTWTRLHTHWGANSGYEFAWQAPREIQIQVAILNMQVSSGAHSQWPVCSKKIGMPNKF